MDKKNLMSQAAQPVDNLSIEDLPIELAELSEEVLSEVRGGWRIPDIIGPVEVFSPKIELCCFCWNPPQIPISSQSVKIEGIAINK